MAVKISAARAREIEYWSKVISENATYLEEHYPSARWARDKVKTFRTIVDFFDECLEEEGNHEESEVDNGKSGHSDEWSV